MSQKSEFKKGFLALIILFIGTGLSAIAGFTTKIVIARHTSPEVFGNYSTILTTITTLAPLCGFGISQYWLKVFGQHGAYGLVWVKHSLIFVTFSTITVFITLLVWFNLTLDNGYLILTACILSFVVFNNVGAELFNSTLQLEGKYYLLSIWQLFQSSFLLVSVLILIYLFKQPLDELNISLTQGAISLLIAILLVPLIFKFIKGQYAKTTKNRLLQYQRDYSPNITKIIKEAAPFGVAGLFYLIYYQFGVVFVRQILGAEEAGYYSVAFTFLSASLLVPGVIYQKFLLPKLHQWAYHDREKFIMSYHYGNYIMLGLGLLGLLTLWLLAPYIVPLLFGEKYDPAIFIVQLMAFNIPLVYIASSAGSLLVTQEHMKTKVKYMGLSALISVLLNYPLISLFGINGAVYTNIICNSFLLIIYFYKVNKDIRG